MVKKIVNLRLDGELTNALKEKAANEGTSQTALIEQGIRVILGLEPPVNTGVKQPVEIPQEDVKALVEEAVKQAVKSLEGRVAALEGEVRELRQPRIAPTTPPAIAPGLAPKTEIPTGSEIGEGGRELPTAQAAKLLGVAISTLNGVKAAGNLPYARNGYKAEPAGRKTGKTELWRVWQE